jgi:hypothetical protein
MAQAKHDSITRRALLSGAVAAVPVAAIAGAPALAAPGFAAAQPRLRPQPDPIFAAIAAHARAYDDLTAFAPELAAAEQAAWHAPRGQRRAANKRLKQAYAAEGRFVDILGDAAERFFAAVPQTLAGAAAALAYVRERYAEGYPMCDEEEECMTLLASTECAICRAAGLAMPPVAATGTIAAQDAKDWHSSHSDRIATAP